MQTYGKKPILLRFLNTLKRVRARGFIAIDNMTYASRKDLRKQGLLN